MAGTLWGRHCGKWVTSPEKVELGSNTARCVAVLISRWVDKHEAVCACAVGWHSDLPRFAGMCYIMVNPEDGVLSNISLPQ